jgi:hypothetical protein
MKRPHALALALLLPLVLAGAARATVLPQLRALAAAVTTSNMGLALPTPGVTPGPSWASQIVTAFQAVDAHDHSSGKGVKVPVAGLNINGDLNVAGHTLGTVGGVTFDSSAGAPAATPLELSTDGFDLWFTDNDGDQIQLTSHAGVNVSGSARGINGQYATDPAHPSAYYTTSQGEYTLTTNGSALGGLRAGKLRVGVVIAGGSLTLTDTDGIAVLLVDTTAPRTITLPAVANSAGRIFWIKDKNGTANTNNVTVARAGSATIDGATSKVISSSYGSLRLTSDGTNWFTL